VHHILRILAHLIEPTPGILSKAVPPHFASFAQQTAKKARGGAFAAESDARQGAIVDASAWLSTGIRVEHARRGGVCMSEPRVDVAVIGGGIAGLTAAYRLSRAGVSFRLFEATQHLGGLIRTERSDGFLIDAGPDTLLAHRPDAIALCDELGLGDRLIPVNPCAQPTSVVHRHQLHALPAEMASGIPERLLPLARSNLFSMLGKLRMAMEPAIRPRAEGDDESIASFFRRRLGREALDRLGAPLLAGIHAGDPERLSLRSTFPALTEMEARYGSLARATWKQPRAASNVLFSLRDGLGELVETLVLRLPPSSLRLGVRVTTIHRHASGFEIEADGQRFTAPAVVLATPLWETARLVVPTSPAAAIALAPVRFASSATVFLAFRRQQITSALSGHGFFVARSEGLRTRACTIASNKYPGRAPDGFVLLKGYLNGLDGVESVGAADDALAELFLSEMTPLLGLCGRPVLSRVYRWPGAMPQMEVGHRVKMAALQAALARSPGLIVIGAGVRGSGVANSVADGNRAATQVLSLLSASSSTSAPELVAH
jgi:oxygen-dependent protoporphyrinogen oxidase